MTTAVGTHELQCGAPPWYIAATGSEPTRTDKAGIAESSEAVYLVPQGYAWDDSWRLASDLLVQVCSSWKDVAATTHLTVQEYGVGASFEEAIFDLVTSLSDYRQSLEARQQRLGPAESKDLELLQELLEPVPAL